MNRWRHWLRDHGWGTKHVIAVCVGGSGRMIPTGELLGSRERWAHEGFVTQLVSPLEELKYRFDRLLSYRQRRELSRMLLERLGAHSASK